VGFPANETSARRYEVGVMEELTSSEYYLRLTDHNTYGIVMIKQLYDGENKEIIAVLRNG
jgi:hypothetical protein